MLYFIVTACVDACPIRKAQYERGIGALKAFAGSAAVLLVENNGPRATYLDDMGCPVLYTTNNQLPTANKGVKELQDVLDCIAHFEIKDEDFIVKMTGRYVLVEPAAFLQAVQSDQYDCVIRYGSFFEPATDKMDDCVTGLVGMRCRYVKRIERPKEKECVEWKWGQVTRLIPDEAICKMRYLGILICPGRLPYFFI